MTSRAFLNSTHAKKIIVGMDRSLWPFTVEYGTVNSLVSPKVEEFARVRGRTLKMLQDNGSRLFIASQSSNPRVCSVLLNMLYPDIRWDGRAIFKSNNKLKQLNRLVGINEDFCLFDHNPTTLLLAKKNYGERCRVFLANELCNPVFSEMVIVS